MKFLMRGIFLYLMVMVDLRMVFFVIEEGLCYWGYLVGMVGRC